MSTGEQNGGRETYTEAGRDAGAVGGEAGLCEGVDVVGGELCDDGEGELGGEGGPGGHWVGRKCSGGACI